MRRQSCAFPPAQLCRLSAQRSEEIIAALWRPWSSLTHLLLPPPPPPPPPPSPRGSGFRSTLCVRKNIPCIIPLILALRRMCCVAFTLHLCSVVSRIHFVCTKQFTCTTVSLVSAMMRRPGPAGQEVSRHFFLCRSPHLIFHIFCCCRPAPPFLSHLGGGGMVFGSISCCTLGTRMIVFRIIFLSSGTE